MPYRIMIIEDEYWTAMDLALEVKDRGAMVAGPFASVHQAMEVLGGTERPDAAILDIRLRSEESFPVADMLMQGGIPFVFATGFDRECLPERFAEAPHFEKPFAGGACVDSALALAEARSPRALQAVSQSGQSAPAYLEAVDQWNEAEQHAPFAAGRRDPDAPRDYALQTTVPNANCPERYSHPIHLDPRHKF